METAQTLQEKAGCLRLMGRLFSAPPDRTVLEDAEALGFIKPGYNLETLQIEFTQLFSLPGKNAICPLACGLSFAGGKSVAQLNEWYAVAGFKPQDPSPAMVEHISTELDFLAHLYLLQAQALELDAQSDAAAWEILQTDFVSQFWGKWIKTFGTKVGENTVSKFYAAVGQYLLNLG